MQWTSITALLTAALAAGTSAQMPNNNGWGSTPLQRFVVSQAQTQALLSSCDKVAAKMNVSENCAVTDPYGLLMGFLHLDNSFLASIEVAIEKARTTVLLNGLTTAQFGQMAQPGQPLQEAEESNGVLSAIGGGYPIYYQGHMIGGFGASGVSLTVDEQFAKAVILDAGFQTATAT